jgi:hypothetical protein
MPLSTENVPIQRAMLDLLYKSAERESLRLQHENMIEWAFAGLKIHLDNIEIDLPKMSDDE